jgi:transcription initiation factor IIE alpha subunit
MIEFKCPKCGNDGGGDTAIHQVEWIPVYRRVECVKAQKNNPEAMDIYIDFDNPQGFDEAAKDLVFHCDGCGAEWKIPESATLLEDDTLSADERLSMRHDDDD